MAAFVPMVSSSPPPLSPDATNDDLSGTDDDDDFAVGGGGGLSGDDDDLTGLSNKLHSIPIEAMRAAPPPTPSKKVSAHVLVTPPFEDLDTPTVHVNGKVGEEVEVPQLTNGFREDDDGTVTVPVGCRNPTSKLNGHDSSNKVNGFKDDSLPSKDNEEMDELAEALPVITDKTPSHGNQPLPVNGGEAHMPETANESEVTNYEVPTIPNEAMPSISNEAVSAIPNEAVPSISNEEVPVIVKDSDANAPDDTKSDANNKPLEGFGTNFYDSESLQASEASAKSDEFQSQWHSNNRHSDSETQQQQPLSDNEWPVSSAANDWAASSASDGNDWAVSSAQLGHDWAVSSAMPEASDWAFSSAPAPEASSAEPKMTEPSDLNFSDDDDDDFGDFGEAPCVATSGAAADSTLGHDASASHKEANIALQSNHSSLELLSQLESRLSLVIADTFDGKSDSETLFSDFRLVAEGEEREEEGGGDTSCCDTTLRRERSRKKSDEESCEGSGSKDLKFRKDEGQLWSHISDLGSTPALTFAWKSTLASQHLYALLNVDKTLINDGLYLTSRPVQSSMPAFASGLSGSGLLEPTTIPVQTTTVTNPSSQDSAPRPKATVSSEETITATSKEALTSTKTKSESNAFNIQEEDVSQSVVTGGGRRTVRLNRADLTADLTAPSSGSSIADETADVSAVTAPLESSKSADSTESKGSATSGSPAASRRAQAIIDAFPLLDFMRSPVLVYPPANLPPGQ